MAQLTFGALRTANKLRLPQFKNCHGAPAHSRADGADWSPAQWLQAVVGELGEYARVRDLYERGLMVHEEFCALAAKELADVQTYLDLLAARALDKIETGPRRADNAQTLQRFVAALGDLSNERKKLDRGDNTWDAFYAKRETIFRKDGPFGLLTDLFTSAASAANYKTPVTEPHATGVDLGAATVEKFNQVSERVGSTIELRPWGEGDALFRASIKG